MTGLYRKALALRLGAAGRSDGQTKDPFAGTGATTEEQLEVMSELSELSEKQRIHITEDTFAYTPGKNDRRLPVLINLAAVGLLLVAGIGLYFFFDLRERFFTSGRATVLTAEGKLLQAVRQDAQSQISQRDQQIADIQQKLSTLDQDRERLKLESEARLKQREEELQAGMDKTLQAEREKLSGQGLSAQEMENRLRLLQEQMESKNRQDLDALRQQVERDRGQQEAAFKALEAEYKGGLERLGAEKSRLEEQLRLKEQELSEKFRQETAALKSEQAKTAESLTRLTEQRQKEDLASEQILSFYDQLRGDLAKPDYDQALRTLASFESFLDQDSIRSLPPIQRRRSVELFVIDSFRALIDRQRSASMQTAPSLLAAAEVLTSIQQAVSQADQAYQAGRTEQARALYLAALGKIPELEHAHSLLSRQEQEGWQAERKELERRIAGLQGELAQSNQALALSRKEQEREQAPGPDVAALQEEIARKQSELEQKERELRKEITGLQQELERVRSESQRTEADYAERRRAVLERLQDLRQRYSRIAYLSRGPNTVPEQELMALLETKLLLKEILVSEAVRRRYPDLYEKTERFLQVFGEVLQRQGQLATLRDLSTIVGSLTEDSSGGPDTSALGRYTDLEVRGLFYKLLDSLRLMVP